MPKKTKKRRADIYPKYRQILKKPDLKNSDINAYTQSCFPGQKARAQSPGISRRTVRRKIGLLKDLELIRVKKQRGGSADMRG